MTPLGFISRISNPAALSSRSLTVAFAFFLRQEGGTPEFTARDIRTCFQQALLKPPSKLPTLLRSVAKGKTAPLLCSTKKGKYSLSIHGLKEVQDALGKGTDSPETLSAFLETALPYLQRLVAKVSDENRKKFLAEAIACLGVQAKRATIVMTWLVMLDHLFDYILVHKLGDFNAALKKRSDRVAALTVAGKDDFAELKESVFIEVARSAGIISNDVRKILDEKLGIRNTFAHPCAVEIHDTKVINFIEDLVDNVITKYSI